MAAQPRLEIGDVITVPIDNDRIGIGQVAAKYLNEGYYFVVFETDYPISALPSPREAVTDEVALVALSLDAKIAAGHWKIVGNEPVRPDLPLPAYKETVGAPDRVDVVDFSGTRRRRATPAEISRLRNRKVIAPVRLERALRALHGTGQWQDAYDELRPADHATTTALWG